MQPYRKPVERPLLAQNLARLRSLDPQLEDIASILELLTGLTETFDMKDRGDSENYTVHCITRARVSYLLLHVPRGDPQTILDVSANTSSVLRETIRLTGLVFLLVLVGFVPCGGPGPISTVSKHAARLCKLLKCHDRRWMGMSELQLWVFVVTAVATVDSHHRTWLASRVVVLMGEVGVSWGGLAGTLKQLAWVDGVLDGRLREIAALAQETAA